MVNRIARRVSDEFTIAFESLEIPANREMLFSLVKTIIRGANIGRGVILAALYLLWRLRRLPRSDWHSDHEAYYVLTMTIFILAEKHREDVTLPNSAWIVLLNDWLDKHGLFEPDSVHIAAEFTFVELELLRHLDYNLDIMFQLPDFQAFKEVLQAKMLADLKIPLPADTPPSSFISAANPFPTPAPGKNPPANLDRPSLVSSARQQHHALAYTPNPVNYFTHPHITKSNSQWSLTPLSSPPSSPIPPPRSPSESSESSWGGGSPNNIWVEVPLVEAGKA